jgi:enoyl-CoA hydratase
MKVDFEIIDDIGIIKLDNPPENYLMTPDFIDIEVLKEFVEKNSLKGLIFQGIGRHFCAGADLENLYKMANDNTLQDKINFGKNILVYISNLDIPTIASVKGVCFGGGLEIALSCSILVSSEKSLFAFPETNLGLMPGLAGTLNLKRKIGNAGAVNMILSGDTVNGEDALKIGLADYVVETKSVHDFSLNIMKKMTNKPLKVIKNVMLSINNIKKMSYEEALLEETRLFCELALNEAKINKD